MPNQCDEASLHQHALAYIAGQVVLDYLAVLKSQRDG